MINYIIVEYNYLQQPMRAYRLSSKSQAYKQLEAEQLEGKVAYVEVGYLIKDSKKLLHVPQTIEGLVNSQRGIKPLNPVVVLVKRIISRHFKDTIKDKTSPLETTVHQ